MFHKTKESKVRFRVPQSIQVTLSVILLVIALAAIPSASSAQRYYGACGGGNTLAGFIAGAKAHGVLDDLARKTGQTPGTDGSAEKIVKDNYVRVIVTRGVTVTNYTCGSGKFKKLSHKKYLPKGTVLWIPAKNAPSAGKTKIIHDAAQENCGNEATGDIPVKRPGHAPSNDNKKSKSKTKTSTQTTPSTPSAPGTCKGVFFAAQNICQSQEQNQSNKTDQTGTTQGPQSPVYNNNINVQVENQNQNGNENNNSSNSGGNTQQQDQSQGQAQQQCAQAGGQWQNGSCDMRIVNCTQSGGQWNTNTQHCDTTPPPGCTSNCSPPPSCPSGTTGTPPNCQTPQCPPGYTGTPPNCHPPVVDHAPQISCTFPAHVYKGGNVYIWCEASDSDNDALSINGVSNNSAGHVSGTIPVNVRWDNTACPAKTTCYRSTFWADNTGNASVTYTVTANGKSAKSDGAFPVLADEGF